MQNIAKWILVNGKVQKARKNQDISKYESYNGRYDDACRHLLGTTANEELVNHSKKESIRRLSDCIYNIQNSYTVMSKTTSEIYNLIMQKMETPYYYIPSEEREEVALQVIYDNIDLIEPVNNMVMNTPSKCTRKNQLTYFLKTHPDYVF